MLRTTKNYRNRHRVILEGDIKILGQMIMPMILLFKVKYIDYNTGGSATIASQEYIVFIDEEMFVKQFYPSP